MRPIFEHITFGTFTAIVMGVILFCLACLVVALSCCKKRLPRRVVQYHNGTPSTISEASGRGNCSDHQVYEIIPPPPRYEDLFRYFDAPPPYQPPTLLTLSQSKLNSREDVLVRASSSSSTARDKDDAKST